MKVRDSGMPDETMWSGFFDPPAVLFLIPRTGFLAAVLLTGYLGGAVLTHLRIGEPFVMPLVIGALFWVALGLRQPGVFALAMGKGAQATGRGEGGARE